MMSATTSSIRLPRGAAPFLRRGQKSRAQQSSTTRRHAIVSEEVSGGSKTGAAYTEFASLLDKYQYNYKVGDVITGKVKACDGKGAWIEIGAKSEALCPTAEASLGNIRNVRYSLDFFLVARDRVRRRRRDARARHGRRAGYNLGLRGSSGTKYETDVRNSVFSGSTQAASVFDIDCDYEFEIIQDDNGEGCLTLSVRRMELAKAWDRCREAQAEDVALTGDVLSVNRGGLLVEVEKLRGFVPQSHIGVRTLNREELIGQQMPFKFIEVDEEKNRLVLSHRLATDMVSAEGLEVGDVVEGLVQAVKPYGAFVDVGGQSGLLHISQISHERIVAVENVLSPGDRIKVLVMSKDAERGRLSLSTKKLEQNHGDLLRNPAAVFETAEEMGRQFREKMQAAEGVAMSVDDGEQ